MTEVPTNRVDTAVAYLELHHQGNSFYASLLLSFQKYGTLSIKQIEAVEKGAERDKARAKSEVNPVTEIGMYQSADGVFRVKKSRESGNLYAMRLVPEATTKSERFTYERGGIYKLTADNRMTVEQCAELGLLYSMCVICGADLTDPKSVARGMGATCAKNV
jgi:hypothetical protein